MHVTHAGPVTTTEQVVLFEERWRAISPPVVSLLTRLIATVGRHLAVRVRVLPGEAARLDALDPHIAYAITEPAGGGGRGRHRGGDTAGWSRSAPR